MSDSIAVLTPDGAARFLACQVRPAVMLQQVLGRYVEYQILSESLTVWAARPSAGPPNPVAMTLVCLRTGMMRPLAGPAVCTGALSRHRLEGLDETGELDLRRWLEAIAAHPRALRTADQAGTIARTWGNPCWTELHIDPAPTCFP